jgi:release factor glutamine methyltransferase
MTIGAIIKEALKETGDSPENRLAIEVLLAFALKTSKEELFKNSLNEISEAEIAVFRPLFERFRVGEPVAYITNTKEFYGLSFYVDERVLIPRPETEFIIDEVLKRVADNANPVKSGHPGNLGYPGNPSDPGNPGEPVKQADQPLEILDIGTGSGCIAITLAKKLPKARFMATDISEDALEVARENAEKHNVIGRIDFVSANLMENVSGQFDIIVANLPYIGLKKFNFVSKEAKKYEPYVALFGGDNGLQIYERLFKQICERKWRPKLLIGEFGFLQGEEIRRILNVYFEGQSIDIIKDYASIERLFVVGFEPYERKTSAN